MKVESERSRGATQAAHGSWVLWFLVLGFMVRVTPAQGTSKKSCWIKLELPSSPWSPLAMFNPRSSQQPFTPHILKVAALQLLGRASANPHRTWKSLHGSWALCSHEYSGARLKMAHLNSDLKPFISPGERQRPWGAK